jgi:hypothetical protein
MILEGSIFDVSFLPESPAEEGRGCAKELLEKNRLHRLKATTNKDLKLLNAILSSKFAAKIGAVRENMKTRLKKG